MVRSADTIEVEVNGPLNESLTFPPIDRRIRGRLDFTKIPTTQAMAAARKYGNAVPGQILGIDVARSTAWIREPLQSDEHKELREKVAAELECTFAEPIEEFKLQSVNAVSTWLFWMESVVTGNAARLLEGKFPAELPGTPRKDFFRRQLDPSEKLLEGILALLEKQGTLLEALAKKV
ncbi:MAG: hypothetical protein ABIK89_01380 [Planctomycetota bacterium]